MARPLEDGRQYFQLYVDFFQNKKTKAIKRKHGALGIVVYLNIWCRVYANGYYYHFDDFNELVMDISEEIVGEREQLRHVSAKTAEAIHYMVEKGIFDKPLFEMNILSSRAIQEQYEDFLKKSKRKSTIGIYNLLDVEESAPENGVNSEETHIDSEKTAQSKVNEITTTYGMVGERMSEPVEKPVENHAEKSYCIPTFAEIHDYFLHHTIIPKDDIVSQTGLFIAKNSHWGWKCLPNWQAAADLWAERWRDGYRGE